MSETKLKPCPFCGGEAHKRIAFPQDADGLEMNMYIVGCKTCDIEFSWLWDEEIAVELWNTRKPIDDIVERLEKVKEKEQPEINGKTTIRDLQVFKMTLGYAIDIVRKGGVHE